MNTLLHELLERYVEVRSQAGNADFRDAGVLEACDERWLKLRKDGEVLYFPITNVRLVKPLN